jgi:hypothetical protein
MRFIIFAAHAVNTTVSGTVSISTWQVPVVPRDHTRVLEVARHYCMVNASTGQPAPPGDRISDAGSRTPESRLTFLKLKCGKEEDQIDKTPTSTFFTRTMDAIFDREPSSDRVGRESRDLIIIFAIRCGCLGCELDTASCREPTIVDKRRVRRRSIVQLVPDSRSEGSRHRRKLRVSSVESVAAARF